MPTQPHTRSGAARGWPGLLILFSAVLLLTAACGQVIVVTPDPAAQPTADPAAESVAEDIVGVTVDTAEASAGIISQFINRLLVAPQNELMRVLLVVAGVVLVVAGWRVYDFVVVIAGFIVGAALANAIVVADSSAFMDLLIVVIGGLIGAALSVVLYTLAILLIGAYFGVALTNGLAALLSLGPVSPLVLLLGAVLGGITLMALSYEFLIIVAALIGAQMLTLGLGLSATWTLIFAVVGVVLQVILLRRGDYAVRRRPRRVALFDR